MGDDGGEANHTNPQPTQSTAQREIETSDKAVAVHAMFTAIARRYDLLNRLLSLGIDRIWRREATRATFARATFSQGATRVLDVATGTADLALEHKRRHPNAEVIGVDFVPEMLELGRHKALRQGLELRLELGDGLALSYPDASFDAVSIAYGLRNFTDIERGLREFYRVLKPGGRLVVLEFPPPPEGVFGRLFRIYFLRVVPVVGGLLSGKRSAYRYLPDSVLQFPKPDALATLMRTVGFAEVRYTLQTLGVSALHIADKPADKPTPKETRV